MLSLVFFIFGIAFGYIGGYIHKTIRVATTKSTNTIETVFEALDSSTNDFVTKQEVQQGSFIEINNVERFLKESDGEVKLGDIVE